MRPKIKFQQSADGTALDLYIYGEVMPDGYDWWTGQDIKSETSAEYFRQQLGEHPNVTQINMYINSPGGDVMEGYGIYAQLKRHPATVTCYVDGFACSVASIIAMAADRIVMYSNSMMMIHEAESGMWGNAGAHRKLANDLDKIMEGNRQTYLQKAGGKLTEQKLVEMLSAASWLTASECLEIGLCDEIDAGREIDQAAAASVMQRANASLKACISAHQAMQKTLQLMLQPSERPTPVPVPSLEQLTDPVPEPAPAQNESVAFRMFGALFQNKKESE